MAMNTSDRKNLEYAQELYMSSKEHSDMSRVRDEWDRADRLVEGFRAAKDPNRANLWIPRTFSTIRAELSSITMSVFPEDQQAPFVYKPPDTIPSGISPDEVVRQAELDTAFAGNQTRSLGLFLTFRDWFNHALKYGVGVIKFAWRRHTTTEFDEVPVMDPITQMPIMGLDGQPLTRPEPKQVVLANRPTVENIDIRNFFWDWDFDTIDDMVFVAHRKVISREELERRGKQGIYRNVSTVLNAKSDVFKRSIEEYSQSLRSLRGMGGESRPQVDVDSPGFKKHAKVEIVEIQRNDRFITIAVSPTQALLRDIENPFNHGRKTYLAIRNNPREKLFVGTPEPILMESLQNEEVYLHNIAIDNMNLALNKVFVADRNADMDLDRLKSRSGNIILTNDVEAVKQLDVSETGISGFQILAGALESAIEDATGVTRTFKGATPVRGETATTTASLLTQASKGIQFKFKEWFHEGIIPFAQMLGSMNRQFMDYEQIIKITNNVGQEDFVAYKSSKIADTEFPVYPVASLEDVFGNRELRQANIMKLLTIVSQSGPLLQFMKPYGFMLEIAKSLGFRNLKQLLMTPEEQMEAQQYQQAYGSPPPGTADLRLLQGGQGGTQIGEGQKPQNAPSPTSQEDVVRAASARRSGQ